MYKFEDKNRNVFLYTLFIFKIINPLSDIDKLLAFDTRLSTKKKHQCSS
jgi:hypothetical protein